MSETAPQPDVPEADRRLPALDGLRGVAILLVLSHHFTPTVDTFSPYTETVTTLMRVGWCGVDLFFVLSGFLITGIVFDAPRSARAMGNFYARRMLRILPLYYGALFVLFCIGPLAGWYDVAQQRDIADHQHWYWWFLANIPYTRDAALAVHVPWYSLDHFWSLAVEEQFYLVWPWIVLFCSRRIALCISLALVVTAVSLRVSATIASPTDLAVYFLSPYRMDALGLGAALALAVRGPRGAASLVPAAQIIFAAAVGACVALYGQSGGFGYGHPVVQTLGFFLIALGAAAITVIVYAAPGGTVGRLCSTPVLRFFGRYSYGLYIFHYLLFPFFMAHFAPEVVAARIGHPYFYGLLIFQLLATAISVGVSVAVWHLYEKHFLRLKRFF